MNKIEVHVAEVITMMDLLLGGSSGRNRVSLRDNGSHGGIGLLHHTHINRELEHRGDQGVIRGTQQFLQGLVSGLHLNHNHIKKREKER